MTAQNVLELEEATIAGAMLLDAHRPGWFREINEATLDVSKGACCIGGQLYGGSYTIAMSSLGLTSHEEQVQYGFTLPLFIEWAGVRWATLTCEWKERIRERKLRAALEATHNVEVPAEPVVSVDELVLV